MSLPLFAVGCLFVAIGMMFLYGFTWRVFRPREVWATGAAALGCLALAAQAVGMTHGLATAGRDANPHQVTAGWATVQHALVASGAMYLAFVPPGSYLRWIERRARAAEA